MRHVAIAVVVALLSVGVGELFAILHPHRTEAAIGPAPSKRLARAARARAALPAAERLSSAPGPKDLRGTYWQGDGLCNTCLTIQPDGRYAAECVACLGRSEAAGHWTVTNATLTLMPIAGHDTMKTPLRALYVLDVGDRLALVQPAEWDYFRTNGVTELSCFQREDQMADSWFAWKMQQHKEGLPLCDPERGMFDPRDGAASDPDDAF